MQEQVPSNITPDQGWSMMKGILDREMPVQKRSRRFPLFWWSTAVIMLIGLSGFVMMINQKASLPASSPVYEQTPVTPAAPVEKENDQQDENIFAESQNQDVQTPYQQGSTNAINRNNTSNSIASSNRRFYDNQANDQKQNANSALVSTPATSTSSSDNTSLFNTFSGNDHLHNSGGISSAQMVSTANRIPVLPFDEFKSMQPSVERVEAKLIEPKKKRKASFSPNVELASLTGSGGTGISLGLGLDAHVAPKVSINGSVGYRSFDPSSAFLGFGGAKSLESDFLNNNQIVYPDGYNYDVSGSYVRAESLSAASYSDVDPVVQNLNQWQSQLGLSYKISRKFSMEAGVGVSFNTKAYSELPIIRQTLDASSPDISNSFNDYDLVRQSNTSFYAGFTYHLGKHVSLKAQWWQTNQPYLTLDNADLITGVPASVDRDDYIRGLNIGVKYSIL